MAQDEFLEDDLDDQKTVEYIKNALPQELKEKYSDDTLYYILDVINDYFTTSGVLDQEPDADGCIDIDISPDEGDGSNVAFAPARGWVEAEGFECRWKTLCPLATSTADKVARK